MFIALFVNSSSPDFNKQRGGPKPGELKAELTAAAAQAAWDNRDTIAKAAVYGAQ